LAPGDPALAVARYRSSEPPTTAEIEAVREELRLDDPFLIRYARWVSSAARGDLGTSYRGEPVAATMFHRFAATLQLAVPAFLLALALALPLGVVAATHRGRLWDHASQAGVLVMASVPGFLLAYILIIIFSVKLHLLPVAGSGNWTYLVMPTLTLGLGGAAGFARLVRSSLIDSLGEDFVRTARTKGVGERSVIVHHALRNSLLVVLILAGLRFGRLLAGAAIVETVFSWQGLGQYVVLAIYAHDYPVIQGFVLFTGTVFVVVNLLVDLLHARLDPRVSFHDGR
ncbi:MAG: ABC transporter permease, partial [Acidimicrobiales bacterium]